MNLASFISSKLWYGRGNKGTKISTPVVKLAEVSVALGMSVMVVTLGIVTGFREEIRNRVTGLSGHILVLPYSNNNSFEQEPIKLSDSLINDLSANPNIRFLQRYATKSAIIKTSYENQGIILKGVDQHYHWEFLNQFITEGKIPDFKGKDPSTQIMVSQIIATKLGIHAGDNLITYFVGKKNSDSIGNSQFVQRVRKFLVAGIYQTGFEDVDNKIVFADLRQIQLLNHWDTSQSGAYEVELHSFSQLDETVNIVQEKLGARLEARSIKDIYSTIFSWLDLLNDNAIIIIFLMIVVSVINMISAILFLILESNHTIGVLKSLGAENILLQKVFLMQAGRILMKGILFGNAIGLIVLALQWKFRIFSLNPETYYVSFVPVNLHFFDFMGVNILSLVTCVLVMLIPVLIISKIHPVKTLRFK